jgi:hypothetical protein
MTSLERAYDALGDLMEEIPDRIGIRSWEIHADYVGGHIDPTLGSTPAREAVRWLADQFDLAYSAEDRTTYDMVQATGLFDGIPVQLWAHVHRMPEPESQD